MEIVHFLLGHDTETQSVYVFFSLHFGVGRHGYYNITSRLVLLIYFRFASNFVLLDKRLTDWEATLRLYPLTHMVVLVGNVCLQKVIVSKWTAVQNFQPGRA